MSEKAPFVQLSPKRHRGWPSDKMGYGLNDMYGSNGWCHACGRPLVERRGNLKLRRDGLTVSGAWQPNWCFDILCVDPDLAERITGRFNVSLRAVSWPRSTDEAFELDIPTSRRPWYDAAALDAAASAIHGSPGQRCNTCNNWRWLPIQHPPCPQHFDYTTAVHIVGSPERFGDGWVNDRHVLVRRELAELIVSRSPGDFLIKEIGSGYDPPGGLSDLASSLKAWWIRH